MRSNLHALAIALALVTGVAPAAAQEAPPNKVEAKRHFAVGNERLKREDYDGAIAEYEKALALLPHALIRYNIGIAYNRKADPVRAITTLEKALVEKPALSPERKLRAQEIIAENAARVARVKITANIDGAEVSIDGVVVGQTPGVELRVASGRAVVVEARKKGFMPVSQVVRAGAGSTRTVDIQLDATELSPGEVRITSQLPGAELFVDGRLMAVTPLRSTIAVSANEKHRLELRRAGYITVVDSVQLSPGTEATVVLAPKPDPEHAATAVPVTFDVQPEDATVRVDGTLMQSRRVKLMAGVHRVNVERTGYETASYDLMVSAQGAQQVSYALVPTTETRASLQGDAQSFQTWGYGLAIGGAVIAATGVALLIFNGAHNADAVAGDRATFEQECIGTNATEESKAVCTSRDEAILDREDTVKALWIASPILTVVGVAGITTGIVMLATGVDPLSFELDGDELGRITVTPAASVGPTGGFVGVTATF